MKVSRRASTLLLGLRAGATMGLLVGGIGGRAAMRLIAVGQGRTPSFTLRGSLVVVAAGTILGAAVGVLYVVVRRFIPGHGVARGLLYSLALQLVGLMVGFPLPVRPPGGSFAPGDVIARLVFSALFFAGACTLELLVARHGDADVESARPAA
jgi:hypothetical protein